MRAVVMSGWKTVEEAFQHVQLFSYSMLNPSEVFLNIYSDEDSFSWPSNQLMICWSISKVRFAWWKFMLWPAMREHSKLRCFFQILMIAFCLSVKTILLRSSELGNCETSERRPVTSTDFYLHCHCFLHCRDVFSRQRPKKRN